MNILRLEKAKSQKAFRWFIRDFVAGFPSVFPTCFTTCSEHFPDGFSADSTGFLSRFSRWKSVAFFKNPERKSPVSHVGNFNSLGILPAILRCFPKDFVQGNLAVLFSSYAEQDVSCVTFVPTSILPKVSATSGLRKSALGVPLLALQ
ncbi:MAG: hypothetical protein LBQ51_08840 [Desulfovibrio sp.]|jgi:hypothetical protein|nr:hypothetical protein [Desulfovibrio sp.]